jgi:hypothetical protein
MKLFKHEKDRKIYGQTRDGLTYVLLGNGEWGPTIHTPVSGMVELSTWEYPVTYESFKRKVGV